MNWVRVAGVCMALSVAVGAFGAHALKGRLEPEAMEVYRIAGMYLTIYGLALFVVAWRLSGGDHLLAERAGWAFLAGIVLFCGSLFSLAFSGPRWLGAVTPLGGLCFIAGWLIIAFS